MKIVVVEDQIALQEELVYFLNKLGYKAHGVANGVELDQSLAKDKTNLLLLDIDLPGEDGISIAKRLSGTPGLVIIMLTASSAEEDRVNSFEGGADNYLVKPVNYRELQAVLQRSQQRLLPQDVEVGARWQLQCCKRVLRSPAGVEIPLTGTEACLLETMVRHGGKTTSRRELIEAMGCDFMTFDERRLEVRISRLRKKMRDTTLIDDPLQSEWGAGYAFAAACALA